MAKLPSMNSVARDLLAGNPDVTTDEFKDELLSLGYTKEYLDDKHRASRALSDSRYCASKAKDSPANGRRKSPSSSPPPPSEFSFLAWCRNKLLLNPDLDYAGLVALSKKELSAAQRSGDKRILANARKSIEERWGVSVEDIPRKRDGSISKSGMVCLFLEQFSSGNESAAQAYFAEDLLELKRGHFSNAKSVHLQKQGLKTGKPHVKRSTGKRRARFVGPSEPQEKSRHDTYLGIEEKLDDLVREALDLKDHELFRQLKSVRRLAGMGVVRSA